MASDQTAQNHVFAGSFRILWHFVLVFIFADYAAGSGDHFISKFGDFYNIDVAFFAR